MTLFFSLLPVYLFGNLHCAGMCGPLMILLSKNHYRWYYFAGRVVSYSLAGFLSAEVGMLVFHLSQRFLFSALLSIFFGGLIMVFGLLSLLQVPSRAKKWWGRLMTPFSLKLTKLLNYRSAYPVFLFGAFTLLLPCGQTLIVFSACALQADPLSGLTNGCLFALFTSPSLLISMGAFKSLRSSYRVWMALSVLLVGLVSICRGFAELEWIPHLILNPHAAEKFHVVIY